MVYCVCTMYLVYMQQLLLFRLQLNLRQLQDSYIWLLPNITPFVLSNLFIGHWDMMYLVYIQHRSSCRGKFRSKEFKFGSAESEAVHIQFIPTIQAFTHPNLCR